MVTLAFGRPPVFPVGPASGDATGATDVAAIMTQILAAKTAGGGIVQAFSGQTYQVNAAGSINQLQTSGNRTARNYAVLMPDNVVLDMNGSILQQRGASELSLVMNESMAGIGAVLSAGLSTTGGPITTLPVVATTVAIPAGSKLVATSSGANGKRQVFTTSALASSGATTIAINSATPTFAFPSGTGLVVRGADFGLINAILDCRNVAYSSHSVLAIGYADRLSMKNVTLKNNVGTYGRLYDIMQSDFDNIGAHDVQSEGWIFGDPDATGMGHNGVYDSTFGSLWGRDLTLFDTASQPANPFDLIVIGCTIQSIYAKRCDGGIKLQQPSTDTSVGIVMLDGVGEETTMQAGFKIQGDGGGVYPAPFDRPTRINVGQVIVRNCVAGGLFMYHTRDCAVASYIGYKNCQLHDATSDIIMGAGINDHIGNIFSDQSGGGGVICTIDNSGSGLGPTGFRCPSVKVVNSGQLGTTLSSALSTGAPITALPVVATTFPQASGRSIVVTNGTQSQTFTTSGAYVTGATSIPVTSQTPNFAYAIGTKVRVAQITEGIRIDSPSTGSFGEIETIDDQTVHTMDRGINDTTSTSVVKIDKHTASGWRDVKSNIGSAGVGTANIADTSGASLAALEATVNAMKALHRARGEWL